MLVAEHIIRKYGPTELDQTHMQGVSALHKLGTALLVKTDAELVSAEFADSLDADVIYFISKHSSSAGIGSFSTHSEGNWVQRAELGGRPGQLSAAAPAEMLNVLISLRKIDVEMEKSYEATHHGPLLKTPSLFAELGGNEETRSSIKLAEKLADAIMRAIDMPKEFAKVVVGIGGMHYPSKFSKLAVEKGYAFSHILPKYAVSDDIESSLATLPQVLERSRPKPELALIDWKSFNLETKSKIIKKLNEIGLEYAKV